MDLKNMHEQIWKRYQSRVPLKYLNKKTDLELLFMNCNAEYGTLSSMKVRTEWSGWVGAWPHYGTKDTTWYVADRLRSLGLLAVVVLAHLVASERSLDLSGCLVELGVRQVDVCQLLVHLRTRVIVLQWISISGT